MSSATEPQRPTATRKLTPRVALPDPQVFAQFNSYEQRVLEFRLREQAECVYSPEFKKASARKGFLVREPAEAGDPQADACDDSGADLFQQPLGKTPTLAEERSFFMQLNFCRYRVMCVLHAYADRAIDTAGARALLHWEQAASRARSEIVRRNMALVLAMAKRTRITGVDFSDLLSEGNLALLRSVDKFDCGRGFKFSTYACRAILKSFSRVATRATRYRGYFPAEFDPAIESSDYQDLKRAGVENDCVDELRGILGGNMAQLSEVEQQVIRARFALDEIRDSGARKAQTLEQVGELIGVTKERVRQIQNKALIKLREALEENLPLRGSA